MKAKNNNRKGLVLIAVLWIVMVLTIIVAVLGRKSRLDTKISIARTEAIRCKWACRAAIEKAVAILNEDDRETDCLVDLWSYDPEDFNDIYLERCWFSVRVIDEAGKLNINTATKEQLLGLPYMDEEIADAIIDWRDTDETPGENGIEGGYYENLTYGYLPRNGPFRTLRELLLVRGVTEELFYGEDTNLNGQLDYNENDGDITPPSDNGDNILDKGWAAYLTCYSSGTGSTSSTGTQSNSTQSSSTQSSSTQSSSTQSGSTQSGSTQSSSTQSSSTQSGSTQSSSTQSGSTQSSSTQSGSTQTQSTQTQTSQSQTSQSSSTESYALINVNTASDIVLAALLGGGDEALQTARSIIAYRDTLMYGIESVSELSEEGIVSSDVLEQIQDYLTVTSNVFTIQCIANADRNGPYGASLRTEAVVDRSTSPCEILYWYQGAGN